MKNGLQRRSRIEEWGDPKGQFKKHSFFEATRARGRTRKKQAVAIRGCGF